MADVDGTYDCTVKSPLGDQKMTLTVKSAGTTFNGSVSGAMGAMGVMTWNRTLLDPRSTQARGRWARRRAERRRGVGAPSTSLFSLLSQASGSAGEVPARCQWRHGRWVGRGTHNALS